MIITAAPVVAVRAAVASDEPLLRRLFVEARPELASLPASLLELQWHAQARQYDADHPHARRQIIERAGVTVGQLVVADVNGIVRLVDLTVAAEHRGRGIARDVVTQLIASGRVVELTVWADNRPARRLYESLGFAYLTHDQDGYLPMRRTP